MKFSTYFGTKEPVTSPFARSSNLFEAKPTTSETIGAYVQETFQGEGSFSQDIRAKNIRDDEKRNAPITQEDWKASENYREGLTFHPTMTEYSAKTLAEIKDDRDNRQLIMDKASKLQTVAGFGVGFLSGLAEPKNLVSGVAAALVTGGVGAVVPSIGRMIGVNSVRAAATRGAAEGVVGAAITEPSNIESSKIVQGDYTMADSMLNLALGSVLGAGLGGGAKALELRARGKKLEEIQASRAERPVMIKEFDTALSQVVQGADVDVAAVRQLDNAEVSAKARQELPRIEEKIAALREQEGVAPDVVIKPVSNLESIQAEYPSVKMSMSDGKANITVSKIIVPEEARGGGVGTEIMGKIIDYADANDKPIFLTPSTDFGASSKARLTKFYKSLGFVENKGKNKDFTSQETMVRLPKKPKVSEDLQRLENKRAKAESDARIQTNNAPIKKLQDDLAKPDNSTAYNPTDSLDIQKYLDDAGDMEDQIRMEQEFETMKEELAQLEEQGLLNAEEIATLEKLADIDKESAIFDNVLLNAKICMTRG
jgi:GNAT superfamily N-acetyltransferase